jgi:hypothetical protein
MLHSKKIYSPVEPINERENTVVSELSLNIPQLNPHLESNIAKPSLIIAPFNLLPDDELIFNYDQANSQFTVSKNSTMIGEFTTQEIVKLMIDQSFNHETNISSNVQFLITNLIGEIDPRTPLSFIFKSPEQSPFIRDVESLINLNNSLYYFEKKQLEEITYRVINKSQREKIIRCVKHFIYHLLIHTLRVLNNLIDRIKTDPNQKKLRKNIANYTVGLVYRVSQFVKDELKYFGEQVKILNDNFALMIEARKVLGQKIDFLIAQSSGIPTKPQTDSLHQLIGGGTEIKSSDHFKMVTKLMETNNNTSDECGFTEASDAE